MEKYLAYINGQWLGSESGDTMPSYNPFNQEVWAEIPKMSKNDVDTAIEAASKAFSEWKSLNGLERSKLMFRLADLIEENADKLALVESTDNGKVIRETKNQVRFSARNYRYFAGYADKLLGNTIPVDNKNLLDFTTQEPLGVCVLITAWNSPLPLLANKLAPALATGNTVVIKPSEQASISTLEFARLVDLAGFPPGVVNVVTGDGSTGGSLVEHPKVAKVSFTGGVSTAKVISRAVSDQLIPTTLELGGKSPNIIFDDASLDEAIVGAMAGIFGAAGQTCIAGSRLLVHRDVLDKVVTALVDRTEKIKLGNPLEESTEMGPVANEQQLNKIKGMIKQAIDEGAELLTGGLEDPVVDSDGYFVKPTIFYTEDPASLTIANEEVFGPVLVIIPFQDEMEAISIANDSDYGLAAGIWTRDIKKAHRVASKIEAGNIWINTYRTSQVGAPFGGIKFSGHGRERSWHALYDFTYTKNIMVNLSDDKRDPFSMQTK
ncbi:aldehyde dehydrogenase [Salirhabdus salicampi]|uniref:aldehyde dehydrogenase n=1 Tax=Salirhabdus salicampi TaxID=476102 RepID=UPI0020C4CF96|nr:aldehyde dehydrogenase [Salirhabdus salicampi]MCP8615914.1 aldehyde dehydrogenase [Salirhabdus salicampi]